jgi:hypothetical protein
MQSAIRPALLLPLLAILAAPCFGAEQFDQLLARVPESANALIFVNVPALHKSALGKKDHWDTQHQTSYLGGVTAIPPTVNRLVIAAQINARTLGKAWSVALAEMTKQVSMSEIAQHEGGTPDDVGGLPVVASPRDAYFVQFGPQTVGTMFPANRQELSRWIQFARQNSQPSVSTFLRDAAPTAYDPSQIVLAVDMTDLLDPKQLARALAQMKTFAKKKVEFDELATTLSSIKGVRFSVRVDSEIHGKLTLEFGKSVGSIQELIKPLILELMEDRSASIDDMDDWKAGGAYTSYSLEGKLTSKGLRQVMSLIEVPIGRFQGQVPASGPGANPKAAASLAYYKAINTLIDDLEEKQGAKKQSFQRVGIWHQKYAEKIDALPLLNVDEELLNWGAKVSSMLRALASSFAGIELSLGTVQKYKQEYTVSSPGYLGGVGVYGAYGGYAGYGAYSPATSYLTNNFAQIRSAQDAVANQGTRARNEMWRIINDDQAAMRRKMTAKYNVAF